MSLRLGPLSAEDLKEVLRPISGEGGFQRLIRRIQRSVDRENHTIELNDEDAERIRMYPAKYGEGGFQRILGVLLRYLPRTVEAEENEGGADGGVVRRPSAFRFRPGAPVGKSGTETGRSGDGADVDLRHNQMQRRLYERLAETCGEDRVGVEIQNGIGGRIDVVVSTDTGFDFYELKVGMPARTAIREGIGQLLEYSLWPGTCRAKRLVVVGEAQLDAEGQEYLRRLREESGLQIEYECVVNGARE